MGKGATPMGMDDWKARDDANHLMESHAINSDPKRMKAATPHLQKLHEEAKAKMFGSKAALSKAKKHDPTVKAAGQYLKQSKKQPYC